MLGRVYLVASITVLLAAILASCCAAATATRPGKTRAPAVRPGAQMQSTGLRSTKVLQSLNKSVTLQGFYYDNGVVKMLLDNMDRARSKTPLPTSAYVPIAGAVPSGVQNGDNISVQGMVFKPGTSDPQAIRSESAAVRISSPAAVQVLDTKARLTVERIKPLKMAPRKIPALLETKYALLIGGGDDYASDGIYFRNGLLATKQLLMSKGYLERNIYVLYCGGWVPNGALSPVSPANKINIVDKFGMLASKVKDTDTLYIMVSMNGGGLLTTQTGWYSKGMYGGLVDTNGDEAESHSESALDIDINQDGDKSDTLGVDEAIWVWGGQPMSDDEFGVQVNRVQHYSKMIIEMDQSFSGGFIRDLTGPRRIIVSSVGPNHLSWTEPSNNWDAFTWMWLGALYGYVPGMGIACTADANGDGNVSMVESYNYARLRGIPPGVAGYEDNGVVPGWNTQMPQGGDGALGLATYL